MSLERYEHSHDFYPGIRWGYAIAQQGNNLTANPSHSNLYVTAACHYFVVSHRCVPARNIPDLYAREGASVHRLSNITIDADQRASSSLNFARAP